MNFEGIPDNDTTRSTDTAWNSGADADWNYRMKFPVTLPCKVPRLKITVWDANFIGREVIGDVLVNLGPKFTEAFRERRQTVHMERQVCGEMATATHVPLYLGYELIVSVCVCVVATTSTPRCAWKEHR